MISSIGSNSAASQMVSNLFSKLDSQNKGYIEKSDLQSAFSKISGSDNSSSVDEVFKQLDGDGDGKITEQEMSDELTKISQQLDSQFNNMRTGGRGPMGGMPPPPPPEGAGSAGFTLEELQAQLEEIGSSDSKRSSVISNVVNNFDQADTDGDGKVSMQEAMALNQSSSLSSTSSDASSATSSSNSEAKVMMKIMQLMHAYSAFGENANQSSSSGNLSVSA